MKLDRTYRAEAAHQLSAGVPEGHQCRRLHGHRYVIKVYISGDTDPRTGMLLEFADIDRRVKEVLDLVDHRFINELGYEAHIGTRAIGVPPVLVTSPINGAVIHETELAQKVRDNSTVENLIAWFVAELKHRFPRDTLKIGPLSLRPPALTAVEIEEDADSKVSLWVGEAP